MDTLGKIALVAGTGLLVGAAVQKSIDIREQNEEKAFEDRRKMEGIIRDQRQKIDSLQLDHDELRHQNNVKRRALAKEKQVLFPFEKGYSFYELGFVLSD